jgi:hypothetical protein
LAVLLLCIPLLLALGRRSSTSVEWRSPVPPLAVVGGLVAALYGGVVVAFCEGERSGDHPTPVFVTASVVSAFALVGLALSPALVVVLSGGPG